MTPFVPREKDLAKTLLSFFSSVFPGVLLVASISISTLISLLWWG